MRFSENEMIGEYRVTAFFAGQQADAITYAVPIRYGKEFLATE